MQGGLPRVRMPTGSLSHFTSTTGPEIVRSDRYPADLNGDLLFADPVGRFIRRAKIVKTEGLTQVRNAYPGSEFIISTDPLFRPVNIKQGPDGALYIVDMYHGIIQDANWTARGTYLRYKIQQYQLDKVINHGRIWRLRFDGVPAGAARPRRRHSRPFPAIAFDTTWPRMNDETPAAARRASHESERLVARHGAAAARPEAGQVGGAGAPARWRGPRQPRRPVPRDVDARRAWCARRRARARADEGSESAHADPGAFARASRSTRPAIARSTPTTARWLRTPTPTSSFRRCLTLGVFKAPDLADVVKGAQAATSARGDQGDWRLPVSRPRAVVAGGAAMTSRGVEDDRRGQRRPTSRSASAVTATTAAACHWLVARQAR